LSAVASYRPSLDGLRAVAITWVLCEHAHLGPARAGGLGVDIFFVLSGYLITGLLTAQHESSGRIGFQAFYVRRAARLYPALLLLVTLGGAVVVLDGNVPVRQLAKAGLIASTYLTDLFTFGHGHTWAVWGFTWSLSIEEHFYLLWPPVLLLLLSRGSLSLARFFALAGAALGVIVTVTSAVDSTGGGPPLLYFQPQAHFGAMLLGCAVALTPRWPAWTRYLTGPALFALLVGILVSPSPLHQAYYQVSLPVAWLLTAAVLIGLEHDSRTSRLLGWNPWRLIGVVSYGLYLYHQLVYFEVGKHFHHGRIAVVGAQGLASLVVATLSYRYFEAPIRRRGRALGASLEPEASAAAA
jgi:peptidoglycan/LPS O-acetylase OafA/YrhL